MHTLFQPAFITKAQPYPAVHLAMTIFRIGADDTEFDDLHEFYNMYTPSLPEQNHYVPLAADGAIAAHDLAVERFRLAVVKAQDDIKSATAAYDEALDKRIQAQASKAQRRADAVLDSLLRDKLEVRYCLHRDSSTFTLRD